MANVPNSSNNAETPLRPIIETSLTEALITNLFQQQDEDGSFPPTNQLARLFNVNFDDIHQELKEHGLNSSIANDVHRFVSTAAILFYFLYLSHKTKFPVDYSQLQQLVNKARTEMTGLSSTEDPQMKELIQKGELAVNYVMKKRDQHAKLAQELRLSPNTWEAYIQHRMGLDK